MGVAAAQPLFRGIGRKAGAHVGCDRPESVTAERD